MGILKDIETYLAAADKINDDGIPSVSIAILDAPTAKIQAHVISNGKEDLETVYQACSISKAITALGVAKLIDAGHLTYETKVVDHIPREIWSLMVDSKTEHLMAYVTVQMLLSHRSGLSQHGFPGYPGNEELPSYTAIFSGRAPSNTPRMRFNAFPGSQFAYSGGGFTLLQLLLETILAKPFADIMFETVLQPLKMTRSRYGDLPTSEDNFALPHYTAYTRGTTLGRGYHNFTELAAAGLWTTPSDLLRAIAAIQTSLHSDKGFLSASTARTMLRPASFSPSSNDLSMALGWGSDATFFAHAGENHPGYTCYCIGAHSLSPTSVPARTNSPAGFALAIMTNSALGHDSTTVKKLVSAVFALKNFPFVPHLPGGLQSLKSIVPYAGSDGVLVGDRWKAFIGVWRHETAASSGEYEIFEDAAWPYLYFDGVREAMRLMPGATPWTQEDGSIVAVLVVDGLDMALRLSTRDGEVLELVQETVRVLKRV